jgi:hypothetical protein
MCGASGSPFYTDRQPDPTMLRPCRVPVPLQANRQHNLLVHKIRHELGTQAKKLNVMNGLHRFAQMPTRAEILHPPEFFAMPPRPRFSA